MREMDIAAKTENLEQVLRFVDRELERVNCPGKIQLQIDIAVEEIFVNIANYAYSSKTGPATIRIEITQEPLTVSLVFIDNGIPYDPLARKDPDITLDARQRPIGGLGIFMVKKSMDSISYAYENGKNILTIEKKLLEEEREEHMSDSPNPYRETLDAYIEGKREEMLKDLSELVSIPSMRGEPAEGKPFGEEAARVLDAMADKMTRYGLRVTDYQHYAIAGDFGPGEKELDILAHLDVVPVSDEWTVTSPFSPLIKDGRIYGRGTADDKGPAIAALYAIRAVMDCGIPLKHSVRLICGSDEECGSSDLDYYYGIEKEAPATFTPDADFPLINLEKARLERHFHAVAQPSGAIVSIYAGDKVNVVPAKATMVLRGPFGEDTRARIEEQAKETQSTTKTEIFLREDEANLEIMVRGTAAHASTPQLGNNALTALLHFVCNLCKEAIIEPDSAIKLLNGLNALFPHGDTAGKAAGVQMQDAVSGELTQNFGIIRYDGDTGIFSGQLDFRAPLCANDENLTAVIDRRLSEAGFEPEKTCMKKAHYVPADSPFVQTLLASYEAYTGEKGTALSTGGGTYVHDLERGVAFGCMREGVDNHMHGDDEFMEIDTLLLSAKIFADVIVRICG